MEVLLGHIRGHRHRLGKTIYIQALLHSSKTLAKDNIIVDLYVYNIGSQIFYVYPGNLIILTRTHIETTIIAN